MLKHNILKQLFAAAVVIQTTASAYKNDCNVSEKCFETGN
ncbi:hypothetical protein AQPE_3957 [Aquipluma nitroreducens]|uniref:Uncharacterized protein n=1 Tax=Aquipluma nitroreducens TaxID=2010828 RepID=A0A5K7SE54_9BACT|nr:hypothetical protein AQPE_3957 [Aquipluma nitroreducens]